MRVIIILICVFFYFKAPGQKFTGEYKDYFGHTLEINKDSTFKLEWKFDLIKTWAIGQWKTSSDTIYLEFVEVYDTLVRLKKPDSLVISHDEVSNRISETEYDANLDCSKEQDRGDIINKLFIRGKRLLLIDKHGRLLKEKQPGIWRKKKRPTWYFKESR